MDIEFDNPRIIQNTAAVEFNDINNNNVRFIKVSSPRTVREHLTPKLYVVKAFSFSLILFSLLFISNLTSPKTILEIPTKSYVDSLFKNNKSWREMSTVFNDHDK